jgi:hypothetical protein
MKPVDSCDKLADEEIVRLDVSVPEEENPWLAVAGMWNNNPDALDAEELSRQYRKQVDVDSEHKRITPCVPFCSRSA